MKKSFQRLRRLNFMTSDIRIHPSILLQTDFQLLNNFQRLQEVGYANVTAYRLANVRKILSNSVYFNQCFNFLPRDINILENIYKIAKVPLKFTENGMKYTNEMQLKTVHMIALRNYMLNHIGYTSDDIDAIWHHYPMLKDRSLQSIDESKQLLEDLYKVPITQLPKFILLMQPEEIKELVAVDTVSGIKVKNVMTLAARCNLARIRKIQIVCSSNKIPDYAIAFAPRIFFINVDTLKSRIEQIRKLKQANEFLQHVGIGKLILSMGRLESYAISRGKSFDSIFNATFIK